MQNFDCEADLESHELGRSLLFMIHNDDAGLPGFHLHEPIVVPDNPFAVIRERLAAVDLAIHDLHVQVQWPEIHSLSFLCMIQVSCLIHVGIYLFQCLQSFKL